MNKHSPLSSPAKQQVIEGNLYVDVNSLDADLNDCVVETIWTDTGKKRFCELVSAFHRRRVTIVVIDRGELQQNLEEKAERERFENL